LPPIHWAGSFLGEGEYFRLDSAGARGNMGHVSQRIDDSETPKRGQRSSKKARYSSTSGTGTLVGQRSKKTISAKKKRRA